MFTILSTIAISLILLAFYYRKYLRICWYLEKLPGITRLPIIGTTYPSLGIKQEDLFEYIVKRNKKFYPIFRNWFGNKPVVHLQKPEYFEKILTSPIHLAKGFSYIAAKPWLGDGLVSVESMTKWHAHRKLITPAFHFTILENFLEIFNEKSVELVEQLDGLVDGKEHDLYGFITRCTLDIICETSMGIEFGAMKKSSEYVEVLLRIGELTMERMLKPWQLIDHYYRRTKAGKQFFSSIEILHRVSEKVVEQRKKSFETSKNISKDEIALGKKKRLAFLDLLIESSQNGKGLTDLEIRQQVDTFLFAGHDTTSSAVCWVLLLLGNHQEIQDKVRQEINDVLQDSTKVTTQHLRDMKYLERVIKETQRLFPSVPSISRLLQEDVTFGEYLIPAGVSVTMHIYEAHRDPENFPEPELFDPDRFLPERSRERHPYSFVPFSAGPRNCIGQKFAMMELKVLLIYILKNFKVLALDSYKDIKISVQIIMRPVNGLRVLLERIQ